MGQVAPRLAGMAGGGAVDPGQRVVLQPIFSGNADVSTVRYAWSRNGVDLPGEVASSLVIEAVAAGDAATYRVTVSNAAGSATVSTELTVRPAAAPAFTAQPRAVLVEEGQSAMFSFTATGSFPRTYQWRRDGVAVPGATSATLLFTAVTSGQAGQYSVEVRNALGSVVSADARLTVNVARPPVLNDFTDEPFVGMQGRRVALLAPVRSGSTPRTHQWRKDGVAIPGATDASLVFDGIAPADAGLYSVVVTNVAGSATSNQVRVTVAPAAPPVRNKLPQPYPLVGYAMELQDIRVSYDQQQQPTRFQWYKDGRALPQATEAQYRDPSMGLDSAGDYFVVVTNVAGSTTSTTARVATKTTNGAFSAPWLAAERVGDVVYFVFATPARLERFDLASDTWLPTVTLPRVPTAATIDNGALLVATDRALWRLALDGTGETAVAPDVLYDIRDLRAWGGFVFAINGNGEAATVRLSDGAKVYTTPYSLYLYGPVTLVESTGVLLGRNGMHNGRLIAMKVQADGSLQQLNTRSELNDLPYGARLMLSPDARQTAAESGSVFDTASLDLVGSMGGPVDDIGWIGTQEPVVLRAGTLHLHGAHLHETRRISTDLAGRRLFLRGGDAFVFGDPAATTSGRPTKRRVALAQAQSLAEPAPLSPERLGFTPDKVLADRDGVVLLYSKLHRQIFRWSTAERRFLTSIAVRDFLDHLAYSEVDHCLYLGHPDGRVSRVRLGTAALAAEPFVTVIPPIRTLATAGEKVWVDINDPGSSYRVTGVLFGREGSRTRIGGGHSFDYTWNPVLRRLYFYNDDTTSDSLYSVEIKPDGTAGGRRDRLGTSKMYPIRVSADGSRVLLGSGKIHDGDTLALVGGLPRAVADAQWVGGRIVTASTPAGAIEVERWSAATFTLEGTATALPGRLMGLLALPGDRVAVVAVLNGLVHVTTLDAELAVLTRDSVGEPQRLANLSSRATVGQGDRTLIPGFVIAGSDPKTVLIRALGPALRDFGVAGAIADPSFTVHNAAGAVIASNDNWASGANVTFLGTVNPRVGAFALGRGSRDAAALLTLPPGAYTVQVRGAGDATGVALVEIYDGQDNQGSGRLVNVATRALVGTGEEVLIAGVVVQAERPKTVLLRALGPTLVPFGVSGALANPRLRVFRDGQLIAENDDWGRDGTSTAAQITAAGTRTGAVALLADSRDSALLLELGAGAYSVQVSGAEGGTGVALVEVYEVP